LGQYDTEASSDIISGDMDLDELKRLGLFDAGLEDADAELINPSQRYLRGDYAIVGQLIAVLTHGKLAKAVADCTIDACAHMQNLREAIHDFKQRAEPLAAALKVPATGAALLDGIIEGNAAVQAALAEKLRNTLEIGLNYLVCVLFPFFVYSFSLSFLGAVALTDIPACVDTGSVLLLDYVFGIPYGHP
jgi:hypothetical protein